ncbi:hypothetical protein BRC67_07525, partial [Halobacteriales archaeon QH_3_68_24]
MVTPETRRRAQMILLGALALAVIIVAVTVVVNSLATTRTAGPAQSSPQIDEAREFTFESRKGSRSLVLRLNHRHRDATAAQLGAIVTDNVTVYGGLLAESYASSRAGYVNLTYHNDSSAFGYRVVQDADSNLSTGGSVTLIENTNDQRRQIGWFSLNVNVSSTSRDPSSIVVTNDTGHSVEYRINRTSNGTLNVTSTVTDGGTVTGTATGTCDPSRDRVLLDLVGGTSFSADCTFNGTEAIDGPYSVKIDGENLVGKYELAYKESVTPSPGPECDPSVDRTEPCTAPVVWTANVSAQFDSSELNVSNR